MSSPRSARDARSSRRPVPARGAQAARLALRGESVRHEPFLAFGRMNWMLMGAGAAAAILGYLLLSRGDITLAPILLVVGYCALIPLGIVWRDRPRKDSKPGAPGGE
jgi:hypothetical protein